MSVGMCAIAHCQSPTDGFDMPVFLDTCKNQERIGYVC
jgi:hypothetical protein